jgi:hypothetical protein
MNTCTKRVGGYPLSQNGAFLAAAAEQDELRSVKRVIRSFAALKRSAANVFAANVYQQDELRSVKRVIRSFAALKKTGRLQKFGGRN